MKKFDLPKINISLAGVAKVDLNREVSKDTPDATTSNKEARSKTFQSWETNDTDAEVDTQQPVQLMSLSRSKVGSTCTKVLGSTDFIGSDAGNLPQVQVSPEALTKSHGVCFPSKSGASALHLTPAEETKEFVLPQICCFKNLKMSNGHSERDSLHDADEPFSSSPSVLG